MNRREALHLLAATAVLPLASACTSRKGPAMTTPKSPVIFLAHGAPMLADDAQWVRELNDWAKALGKPKAVLILSAHWDERPLTIGATTTVPLLYDFYGFPERYYQVTYPAPGAPALAARVRELLSGQTVKQEPQRGLDHGVYVPLKAMWPDADVPVLQVSLPGQDPKTLFALGQALAPLRHEGVLIIGSGFLTHNMRAFGSTTPAWASEFDQWVAETLDRRDVDSLIDYRARSPGVQLALPTHEHFVPVLVSVGAAAGSVEPVSFPITGFMGGSFTRRSVQFG